MVAAASVAMNAATPTVGLLLERVGRRASIAVAASIEVAGLLLLDLSHSKAFDMLNQLTHECVRRLHHLDTLYMNIVAGREKDLSDDVSVGCSRLFGACRPVGFKEDSLPS